MTRMNERNWLGRLGIAGLTLAAVFGLAVVGPATIPIQSASAAMVAADDGELDTIVFRNGQRVSGRILEETDTQIRFMLKVGTISSETTYRKSEILEIVRGKRTEQEVQPAQPGRPSTALPDSSQRRIQPKPGQKVVYRIDFKGQFGRDVSLTPLRQAIRDARDYQPDILLIYIDCDFVSSFGDEIPEYAGFFDQFMQTDQMAPILTQDIRDDSAWVKKPRLVFWVRRAMGGPAFLPFVSPTIYYTSDARHGGIGDLSEMFAGVGDPEVREKQRSLRLGRAEGLALTGGHPVEIMRAMARRDYVLSMDLVGGRPVFYPNLQGNIILATDGRGVNAEPAEDIIAGRSKSVLLLNAETAMQTGVASGVVDTLPDLLDRLGVGRDAIVVEGRANNILQDWGKRVTDAERTIRRLIGEYNRIDVQGDYRERTRARGLMLRHLRQIRSLLNQYGESINPRTIQGYPEQMGSDINVLIDQLEQMQRLDSPP